MRITATKLRADIYNVLDRAIDSGEAVEIERNGHVLRLVPPAKASVFDRLMPHPGTIVGDPDDLVHLDWSHEWKP